MTLSRKLEGLYLVVSPILPPDRLISACEEALAGGVDVIQFSDGQNMRLPRQLAELAREYNKPFIVNNDLSVAKELRADGIHFDGYDVSPAKAKETLGENCIVGYTVNVDLDRIRWAEESGADYVSFCSVFSNCTATHCPIVPLQTIRKARAQTKLPLFAAGGINLRNAQRVLETGVNGIVVTSAILEAENPKKTAEAFKQLFL